MDNVNLLLIYLVLLALLFLFVISRDKNEVDYNKLLYQEILPEKQYISNIPKVVIQTSKNKLSDLYIHALKLKLNGWEYKHFTDSDILQFFKDNPIPDFKNIDKIFLSLHRGEHKADLFRYYYLYCKGGVYIDTDMMIYKHVEDIIKDYDFVSCKNIVMRFITQGFIGVVPKSEIMYLAIKDFYTIDITKLKTIYNYTLLCHKLKDILNNKKYNNVYLYTEYVNVNTMSLNCYDQDNDNKIIIKHFALKSSTTVPFEHLFK